MKKRGKPLPTQCLTLQGTLCPVGWSDLLLIEIFENGHIAADQVYNVYELTYKKQITHEGTRCTRGKVFIFF